MDFYQKALSISDQATRLTLNKFKVKFRDGRSESKRKVDRSVVLKALEEGASAGLSLRQIGKKLDLSHEAVRLIAKELKFERAPAPLRAGQRASTQHKTQLALRFRRRYWLMWSCEAIAQRVGLGLTTLQRGLADLGLSWPHGSEMRQRRLKQFGELWCPGHEAWLPKEQFNKDSGRESSLGYQCYCRACHAERNGRTKALVGAKAPC